MGYKKTLTPGAIELEQGTLSQTKEDIRLDQLIPSEILENQDKLDKFLKAYYTFMNMDEFIYQETNTFTDVILNGQAQFRIPDPSNENNKFFTDETGASSSLVVTAPGGTTTTITLNDVNVAITNGNELPGTLVTSTSEIGKTFTVNGLTAHNNSSAKLTTIQKNWVGPGPSYVMNSIEQAMDIDTNSEGYLELMQKEIAATIPRGVTVDKRTLYKQIIDFYRLRGSSDSIEIFFKILFNDTAEVEFPYDSVLIPSSGNWDVNAALPKGGQYLDNKGFLSDTIVVQDSKKYQKFSYLIKTGKNLSDWDLSYNRLVHPAGFIYFAEILIFLQLTKAVLGEDIFNANGYVDLAPNGEPSGRKRTDDLGIAIRKVLSAIPDRQPGIIGPEDIPILIEMFVSTFLPNIAAKIHKSGTVSIALKNGIINATSITAGGTGYTAVPVITSSDSGTPSGHTTATLTAVLTTGSVSSITIGNGGKDYNTAVLSIAAPTAQTFNGSSSSIVSTSSNNITLTAAQKSSWVTADGVTYNSGGGTSIGGLVSGTTYFVKTISGNTISLAATAGGAEISISGLGSGTSHTLTGITATATATTLNGALEALTIGEPGFGYSGSSLTITFNGISIPGLTGVNPSVTVGLDGLGRLNKDAITVNSEGRNWQNLFGAVPANSNATKIASVNVTGLADKTFTKPPVIAFPIPQSKDATGAFLSSNVTATAKFNLVATSLQSINVTHGGSGYNSPPSVSISGNATGKAILENSKVTKIILVSGGSGYTEVPTITMSTQLGGTQATAEAILTPSEINNITITNAGSGYINDPIVTIGSEANNESRVADQQEIIEVNCNHNNVDTLITEVKTNPVQATGSQDGVTLFDSGRIRDGVIGIVNGVSIVAGGSGYTSATVQFNGGGATVPATGTVTISSGAVTAINIITSGFGYTSIPTVVISGDGSSATATATVNLNWTISQSSSGANKKLPESRVKVVNASFRTIINNNYIQRKGTDNFYNTARLYNSNQTIEFLGSKTLQTIDSSDINNNNTSTFVHIE